MNSWKYQLWNRMRSVDCLVLLEKLPQWCNRTSSKHPSSNKADVWLKMFYPIKSIKARPIRKMEESTSSTLMVSMPDFSKICLWKKQETWMTLNQIHCKLIFLTKTLSSQLWFNIKDIISRRLESNYQISSISQRNSTPCKGKWAAVLKSRPTFTHWLNRPSIYWIWLTMAK